MPYTLSAQTDDIQSYYTSLAVFLLGSIALVVDSGYSIGAALLLLGGLYSCCTRRELTLTAPDYWIIATLVAFATVGALDGLVHGEGVRALDKPIRFALASFAMVLLMKYPPRLSWLWAGLALGGILTAAWTGYQKFFLGAERAGGYTHLIQFGNIAMLTGFFCLAGLNWAAIQNRRWVWMVFLLLGAIGGVLASLLSGSRGGWVGMPLILLVLYRAYRDFASTRTVFALAACIAGASFAVYNVPQLGVQQRVHSAVEDIQLYQQGISETSIGARFEMWRGAAQLFAEKPVFGWGSVNYQPAMQDLVAQGRADPVVAGFGHPHNEMLNVAAKQGIVGVLALLALYLIPLRLFAPGLQSPNLNERALATAGTLLPVAYIDFGISQAFLVHNSGVMIYAFWLAVLWGCYRCAQRAGVSSSHL